MKITEKLLKPITETKYLSVDNFQRYRTIIRFFYIQYEKIKYWLYKEDIFGELKKHEEFSDYTMEQCKSDLMQLKEWGNLIADQDTSKVYTIEDFKNKQFRYQLSEYSVEIERMSIKLENLFIEGASLEPTLLERLKTELSKVITLKNQEEVSIYAWWDAMNNDFIRLNQNYQDYIRDLNSIDAEEMMKKKEFLVFKDKLMEYLRTFVKSLQKNTAVIESVIKKIPREDILWILNKVVKHEMEIPRLDTIPSEVDIKDMIYGRWESIETWFMDKDGVPNEASKLFDATNEIIRKITRYATQITELYNLGANRKEEYRKLSQIFGNCTDINEAHRLSALVFGIDKPAHIKGEFFRKTDNINSGVYDEEAFLVHLTPRIRTYRERFQRNQIKEHSHEKEMMRKVVLEQWKKEQELLESYIVNYEIDFSSLPCIEPEARNVLLIWLSKGLENTKGYAKTENGKVFYVDVSHKDKLCKMKCSDGVFLMPQYKIVFDNKRAKS